jgi:glycosyltransferase involved in cell wall biosynthesis
MDTFAEHGMSKPIPGLITVIIIDENDLLFERTMQSVVDQELESKEILVLSSRREEEMKRLLPGSPSQINIEYCSCEISTRVLEKALRNVKTTYVCIVRANEPLLSRQALSELVRGFDISSDVVLVASDLKVISTTGEESYRVNYPPRIDLYKYDLLNPAIFKGGGRGIAFRASLIAEKGLLTEEGGEIGLLMKLANRGRFVHISNPLVSINQTNFLSADSLRDQWLGVYRDAYRKTGTKTVSRQTLLVSSFYQELLALVYADAIMLRIIHSVFAKILYPFPWIKNFVRYVVMRGVHLGIRLLAFFGSILFQMLFPRVLINKKKKFNRVGVVSHVMPPSPSGQSVVLERIFRDISFEEYQLIQTRPLKAGENSINTLSGKVAIAADNIPAEKLYRNSTLFFLSGVLKSFVRGWKIARIAAETECDKLVGCTGDLFDPPATYFAGRLINKAAYLYYFDDYRYQWVDRRRRRFSAVFEELFHKTITGFVVPNEFMQRELLARSFVDTQIVRNPAGDFDDGKEIIGGNLRRSEKKVIYTGSVYHVNVEALKNTIEALEILGRKDIRLHVFSSQSEEELIQYEICGANVVYHPHVPPEEISRIQESADILLIPFSTNSPVPEVIKTSAPGKLGDYLASGTPVLAAVPADSFVSWFLESNDCGYVATGNDPQALANKIELILNQGKEHNRKINNAKAIAQGEFSRKKAQRDFECFVLPERHEEISVLQISATDLGGQQFNGYLLGQELAKEEIHSYMSIAYGQSISPMVFRYGYGSYSNYTNRMLRLVLDELSLQSVFPTYNLQNFFPKNLLGKIDLVHLQLFHAAPFFDLHLLPKLGRQFPLVCTVHDQWLYTGHCVHPLECEGWLNGCKNCPDLRRNIPMKRDRAAYMWRLKRRILSKTKMHLIVSSQWMFDRVKQSPLVAQFPCSIIPFGVDTSVFYPEDKAVCRREFNIPDNHKVIAFRAAPHNVFKGHKYIVEALKGIQRKDITLLTIDKKNSLEELKSEYNIIDLGWVNSQVTLRKVFSAADIFLAPSIAESFGLMPLEAMACGAPVIVFRNTVFEQTTHAPEVGIAVDYKDSKALQLAIEELIEDPEKLEMLSKKSIELIQDEYTFAMYAKKHAELYRKLILEHN